MDEQYLIVGLNNKDKVVFDFVFNYYYSGLCAYAGNWIDDRDAIEDLVQEFFVKLWLNSSKLKIQNSLKSYFFGSIRNKAFDYLRHLQVKENYSKNKLVGIDVDPEYADWEFAESELTELIEKSMQKLPPRCREIFILSRFEGRSNDEIANQFGISKRTVELQISNALKALRSDLKDYLPAILFFWLLR